MTVEPPRSGAERKRHALELLGSEVDVWVATADSRGAVCQIPLCFDWGGAALTLSTPEGSVTGRNLAESGQVRIALGSTRDVVLIEGTVRTYNGADAPSGVPEAFAAKHGWDPRETPSEKFGPYAYFVVTPVKVQAWREENELVGRTLMASGQWRV